MPWILMAAHVIAIPLVAVVGRSGIRRALAAAAVIPATTAVWAIGRLATDGAASVHEFAWVDGLDLTVRFRIDALALLMTVLVSGIGALVFVYATGYFSAGAGGASRFPASLLAFSTSMLGLVWADSIWTLFIFWEFTSITSFLLVGHKNTSSAVRTAARRALMITGAGGLALLAGLLVLGAESGTSIITDLEPISGAAGAVAAVLVLVGAATKSAQVPFHVWLPGAMAAPTPVSAYLHSATMVKAGVLLVAVVGSAFADVATWGWVGLFFGISSMLWGAIGALRHRDAKLILAWGTVSQLGLLITLLSLGTAKGTFAAVSLLFAHALFKAALFLVVGEIDIRTGTRDVAELGGLASKMPIAFAVAVIAGLSMAGVPPLLGFTAKEAAIEAVLGLESDSQGLLALVTVVGGAVLTVAYTLRFLIGVFGPGPDTEVSARRLTMTAPAVILAAATGLGYVFLGIVNDIVGPAAVELDAKAEVYELLRWPGLKTGFVVSMVVVAAGAVLGWFAARSLPEVPSPVGANSADRAIDRTLDAAIDITARIQHGSLPVYLATMASVAIIALTPFLSDLETDDLVWFDNPLQGFLAVAIVASAAAGAFVGSRLGAALTLGAVGIAVAGLFLLHGAPDLALTQLLVETIIVVGFVIGLGFLTRRFPPVADTWRGVRLVVAGLGGLGVAFALAAAGGSPTGSPPVAALTQESVDVGGGNNVVNVILTDLRALDTLGEVVVLATVAIGILALARSRSGLPEPTEGAEVRA